MNETPQEDRRWTAAAREILQLQLDAAFQASEHAPHWFRRPGSADAPYVQPVPLPTWHGWLLAHNALGRLDELATHYRRLLVASPLPPQNPKESSLYRYFHVELILTLPNDEHPLFIDIYGGGASVCESLLADMADRTSGPRVLYDDLDQGQALRILCTEDHVFVREWDWENMPPTWERAFRFSRETFAAEAVIALHNLREVHHGLVDRLGEDLWDDPEPGSVSRWR